jgi:hypothetical protein
MNGSFKFIHMRGISSSAVKENEATSPLPSSSNPKNQGQPAPSRVEKSE